MAPAASLVFVEGVREWAERIGRKYERGNHCNFGGGRALAGLILTSSRGLESRLDERINKLESQLREDMKQLTERVARVEHSQAKLEGLLEGLREAITGRAAAS